MKKFYQAIKKYKIIHIIYWIYAAFDLWHILVLNRGKDYVFNKYDFINDIAFQMISVYSIIYVLIPKFYVRQKYFLFVLLSIATCFLAAIANSIVATFYIKFIDPDFVFGSTLINVLAHFINNITVSVLFVIVILIEHYVIKEQLNRQLEKERIEYELNFLKAQMNPHFMFNALNSIYFLMDKNIDQAKNVLLKFSSLLRYQLYDCSTEKCDLRNEIDFLSDYVALEKIRSCENVTVEFNKPDINKLYFISPLMLIPFVENAFKYVSRHAGSSNFISINCSVLEDTWLLFTVENSFVKSTEALNSNGLGIMNVKRRLEILYPDLHTIEIKENGSIFKVNLKIRLK